MPKHDFKNKRFVRGLRHLASTLAKVPDVAELLQGHAVLVHSSIGRPSSALRRARRPASASAAIKKELLEVVLRWQADHDLASHASVAAPGGAKEQKLRLVFSKDGDVRVDVDQDDAWKALPQQSGVALGISGLDVKNTPVDTRITREKDPGIFYNFQHVPQNKQNHKIQSTLCTPPSVSRLQEEHRKYGGVCKVPPRRFVGSNTCYLKAPQSIQSTSSLVNSDNFLPSPQALKSNTERAPDFDKEFSEILLRAADLISQRHSNSSLLMEEAEIVGGRSTEHIVNATPLTNQKIPHVDSFPQSMSQPANGMGTNKFQESKQTFQPFSQRSRVASNLNLRKNNIQIAQQPPSLARLNAYLLGKSRERVSGQQPQGLQQLFRQNKTPESAPQALPPEIDPKLSDAGAKIASEKSPINSNWCRIPGPYESNSVQNRCPLESGVKTTEVSGKDNSQSGYSPQRTYSDTWEIPLPDIEFPSLQCISHARFLSNIPENDKWNIQKPRIPRNDGDTPASEDDSLFTELPEEIDTWLVGWPDDSYYKEALESIRSCARIGAGSKYHRTPQASTVRCVVHRRQLTKLTASKKRLAKRGKSSSKDIQRESKSESGRFSKDRASVKRGVKKRKKEATGRSLGSEEVSKKHYANNSETYTELVQKSSSVHKKIPKTKDVTSHHTSKRTTPDEQRKEKVSPVTSQQSKKLRSTNLRKGTTTEVSDAEEGSDHEIHKRKKSEKPRKEKNSPTSSHQNKKLKSASSRKATNTSEISDLEEGHDKEGHKRKTCDKQRKEKPLPTESESPKKPKSSTRRRVKAATCDDSPPESVSSQKTSKSSSKEKSKKRYPPAEPRNVQAVPKTNSGEKPSTRHKEKGDSKPEGKASSGEKPRARPPPPPPESQSQNKPNAPSHKKQARSPRVLTKTSQKVLKLPELPSPLILTPPNSVCSVTSLDARIHDNIDIYPSPYNSKVALQTLSHENQPIKFSPLIFPTLVTPAATDVSSGHLQQPAGIAQSRRNSRELSRLSFSSDGSFSVVDSMSPYRSSHGSSFKESSTSHDSCSSLTQKAAAAEGGVANERVRSAPPHRPLGDSLLATPSLRRKPFLRRVQDVIKSRFFNCTKLKCRGSKCFCARESDSSIEDKKGINV